jgi:NADH:ubiquinone oxidoreductase subunit F (NADH-binding)/(2Fe-2S) ferredoxin/Pyruvate/2-oxoacid:ferredoxin oxidoreductase delta subunit
LNEAAWSGAKETWKALKDSERPVIYLGVASCGRAAGALAVKGAIQSQLKSRSIDARIVDVGCIGPCFMEPLVYIQLPGGPPVVYANVTVAEASRLVDEVIDGGAHITERAIGVLADAPMWGLPRFFDHPMLAPQVRLVLRNCGLIDPTSIEHYLAMDGYLGLKNALAKTPEQVIEEVAASGLRGRGGAGFSTGMKWKLCRDAPGDVKYLICNADEGNPGTFVNRTLLEGDPHAVLEGMVIAAYAIGASLGFIYIRHEYPLVREYIHKATLDMRRIGLLGDNIMDSGFDFDIQIRTGALAFVCGEETALMASVMGHRGMPKPRPPFPATSGLWGKPTNINNTETMGTVPLVLRMGGASYAKYGIKGSSGTKTFSLGGKVRNTGCIEVPMGTPLRNIVFDIGGGVAKGKSFKAVQTGGPSGGCVPSSLIDTGVDYEKLTNLGAIMGSGGLIVMDEDTCMVDMARYFLSFTQDESCGKCVPCRIGTKRMLEILERITQGEGDVDDILRLEGLCETINKGSLCGLGQTAPNPILTTLRYFRNEYDAHIIEKRCPARTCKALMRFEILAEKCTGCDDCRGICAPGAISGEPGIPHAIDQSKCTKCGVCQDVCPPKNSAVARMDNVDREADQ